MVELTQDLLLDEQAHAENDNEAVSRRGFSPGTLFLLGAILVAGVIFGVQLSQQNQTQPTEGQAPDFTVTTFDGQEITLSDLRGKVVFINFWASWCAPCRDEAPDLQAAWERYEGRGDVVFLGIAYADNGPRSLEYLDEYGITFLNAPDVGTRISEKYHIRGVPESFLIDKEGNVARFIYAGINESMLVNMIDDVLAGGTSS